ncbi:MAG: ABC transporter permease [Hoeflea sp.]|uniref:ABC transporter permease n=1 Tax=Hoeflea sp. TaxID=1940281 RepID=UPI001DDFA4B8|nr:ABC transporter permease [Hoeflea sp.]MBU4528348.1 ABC transporter permease [Alphaproteobacteria bacterium]MBU4543017.1 ABC transporter permease [Alphaproteobacteria bacterium]MBU4551708.1 ABC transporter permease [Alphaproteobacteria bacterium]MBV1723603.1 ABC transporter permease [Hoeflea sp.]MBV1761919.1 ABC transporter permease [Hoeflea sp.]
MGTAGKPGHGEEAHLQPSAPTLPVERSARRTGGPRFLQTETGKGWLTISPPLIYAVLLLIGPIIVIITHSFWTQDYLTIDRTFTLDNYKAALTEPIYRDLLMRSLFVSVTVAFVTVILAYPVAWFVSFHGGRYKGLWLFIITVPFWSGYLLRILSWKVILGYKGVLNSGLLYLGVIAEPLNWLIYNVNAVIITLAHSWAAFAILPLFVSLEKLDRSLLEAAADLGDGPVRRFLRVTLPLTMPGIIAALLIVMIPTVGDYVTPRLVGGKDGVMIANAIQAQFGKASNWPLGAALAVTTMVIVSLVAGAIVLMLLGLKRLFK